MDRDEAKQVIAGHADELRALGIRALSLFGSTARNQAAPGSDINVLIELSHEVPVGLLGLARIQQRLESILGNQSVDLVVREAMFDELKDDILSGAVPCLSASGTFE